jgi:hypothetical protein
MSQLTATINPFINKLCTAELESSFEQAHLTNQFGIAYKIWRYERELLK